MSAISWARRSSTRALTRSSVDARAVTLALAALATTVMLQAMRVLLSYLVVVVGQANRSALVRDTLAVFIAIALAPLLIWLIGLRATAIITGFAMAVIRVVLQFWTLPDARLLMAAAIVILWGWLTISLLGHNRHAVALGLIAGLVLDVAVRVAFLTLDLPWNSGFASGVVTVALSGLLLAAVIVFAPLNRHRYSLQGSSLSLVAVGPGLAMFHLIGGNLGLAQTKTGLGFAASMAILGSGLVAGVVGSVLVERQSRRRAPWLQLLERAFVIAIGAVALWLFWNNKGIAPFTLPLVVAANLMLIGGAVASGAEPARSTRPIVPALWFTLGMLLQVGILFYYYDSSGRPMFMVLAAIMLAAGAVVRGVTTGGSEAVPVVSRQVTAVLVAPLVLLAFACGWQFIGMSGPTKGPALPATFTVMTYNLQDGFAADNSFDLEAQAETVAAAHPDVVVLQEVSRGWLVTSGADEALWLSHRLKMPIYFGGNSDDGLWGNAILTRAPVSDVKQLRFTVTKNLKRGAVEIRMATVSGEFWVVGTHLDNPKAADAIRVEQARQLIASLKTRHPALVLGDFNADPGTAVLDTFDAAGLTDPGTTLLGSVTTTTDARRLDYVLVSSGLRVDSMQAIDSPASDHKPVVATLTLSPQ